MLIAMGFIVGWKTKNQKVRIGAIIYLICLFILYPKIHPSYLPKGEIQRSEVPGFEPSKAEINDRNRKPEPTEVRQSRQEKSYKEGTGF